MTDWTGLDWTGLDWTGLDCAARHVCDCSFGFRKISADVLRFALLV